MNKTTLFLALILTMGTAHAALAPTTTAGAILPPQAGHSGEVLSTNGAGILSWAAGGGGSGTVTSVGAGTGLTGGPITGSGTLSLAPFGNNRILANVSGSSAAPVPTFMTQLMDILGTTQGSIAYRGASSWTVLTPGTSGQVLSTQGTGANPQWINAPATGVTSVGMDSNVPAFFFGNTPITSSGDIVFNVNDQDANKVFAGPVSGGSDTPSFRVLTSADIPWPLYSQTNGAANAPAFNVGTAGDNDTGIYTTGDGNLSMSANGFLRFQIDQNETTVTGPLHITGNLDAANYPPVGSANRLSYYDGTGALASVDQWTVNEGGALSSSVTPAAVGNTTVFSAQTDGSLVDENLTGIQFISSSDTTNGVTGIFAATSGNIGTDIQMLRLDNTANAAGGLTMQSIVNNGTFGSNIRFLEANNGSGGTGPGGIFYNMGNQAAMSNDWLMLNVTDSGTTDGNLQMLNINKSGDVDGNSSLINVNVTDDTTGSVQMLTLGQNGTSNIGGDFTGINAYTQATVTGNSTMAIIADNGTSTGKNGLNINLGGTSSSYVNGLTVNVDGVSATEQKIVASLNGGALTVQSPVDTSQFTPGGAFFNNVLGGQFHIADGFPVSGVFGFGNTLSVTILAEDDMAADNFIGSESIGYSVNGTVNQAAVVSGKTFDTLNYMAAGGAIPSQSTGGTINHLSLYRALGILPSGGTLSIGELSAFEASTVLCAASPTNCYGVYIRDAGAKNDFAGDVIARKHLYFDLNDTPTLAPGSGAGSGSPTCVLLAGAQNAGTIRLVTGSADWADGSQCVVTFASSYAGDTPTCTFSAHNVAAATNIANTYATTAGGSMTFNFVNADTATTTYEWDYHCFGNVP